MAYMIFSSQWLQDYLDEWATIGHIQQYKTSRGGYSVPKTDGGVPLAAENWTQKDRGKNEIWGPKDRIL